MHLFVEGSWVVGPYGGHLRGNVGLQAQGAPASGNNARHHMILWRRGSFGVVAFLDLKRHELY